MKARPVHVFGLGLMAALCTACSSPNGRAAKKDATVIQKSADDADTAITGAQGANSQLAATNADLSAGVDEIARRNAAAHRAAQRIDDKAVVLLKARWRP